MIRKRARVSQLGLDFDAQTLTVAPSPSMAARETSALSAVSNQPHRGTQNDVILRLITASGRDGMSDYEIQRATGYERSTICARRRDLQSYLTAASRRGKSPFGKVMTCWRRKTEAEIEAGL